LSRFLPRRAAIDAYGNGGFLFAEMSHRGSILIVGGGIHAWQPSTPLSLADFALVFEDEPRLELLLLGTGRGIVMPPRDIRQAFADARIGLETMDTGAAVGTYNILFAEGRRVGAALTATD
jgi:uncharacterized protein